MVLVGLVAGGGARRQGTAANQPLPTAQSSSTAATIWQPGDQVIAAPRRQTSRQLATLGTIELTSGLIADSDGAEVIPGAVQVAAHGPRPRWSGTADLGLDQLVEQAASPAALLVGGWIR